MATFISARTALDPRAELISALTRPLSRRWQQTFGLGHFFNGWRRADAGWRFPLAVVEVTRRCAFTLAVAQTPPGEDATKAEQEETRSTLHAALRAHRHRLPSRVKYHCVDGYYAKKKYIAESFALLHAITKLRSDADCWFLYTGPHPKRRGKAEV